MNPLHWLIVAALLGYFYLLVKVAKPTKLATPVSVSNAALWTQTILAWLSTLCFGVLTFAVFAASATRKRGYYSTGLEYLGGLLVDLGVPLLFALSVRWSRALMCNRIVVRKVNG